MRNCFLLKLVVRVPSLLFCSSRTWKTQSSTPENLHLREDGIPPGFSRLGTLLLSKTEQRARSALQTWKKKYQTNCLTSEMIDHAPSTQAVSRDHHDEELGKVGNTHLDPWDRWIT